MSHDNLLDELRSAFEARSAHIEERPELLDQLLTQAPSEPRRRIAHPLLAAAAAVAVIAAAVVIQRDVVSSTGGAAATASALVGAPTHQKFPPSGLPSYFVADQIRSVKPWQTTPVIVNSVTMKVAFHLPVALRYAQLSPDGTRVYGIYAGATAQDRLSVKGEMRVVYYDLRSGRLVDVARGQWVTAVALSADGRSLAFAQIQHTPRGDITRIEVRSLASGRRTVFEVPHANATLAMALSPDGGTIAFTQTRTPNILFVLDIGTHAPGRGITPVVPPASCTRGAYDYPVWNSHGLFALQECDGPLKSAQTLNVVGLDPTTLQPDVTVTPLPRGGALAMTVVPVGTENIDVLFVPAAGPGGNGPAATRSMNSLRLIGAQTNMRPKMTSFSPTTP